MDNDGKKKRALLSLQMLAAVVVCSFCYVAFKNGGDAPLHAQLDPAAFAGQYLSGCSDSVDNYIFAVNPASRFTFYQTPFRRLFSLAAVLALAVIFCRKWLNYKAMSVSLLHNLLFLRKIFKRAGPDWIFL